MAAHIAPNPKLYAKPGKPKASHPLISDVLVRIQVFSLPAENHQLFY